jgi:hypothetical protein
MIFDPGIVGLRPSAILKISMDAEVSISTAEPVPRLIEESGNNGVPEGWENPSNMTVPRYHAGLEPEASPSAPVRNVRTA